MEGLPIEDRLWESTPQEYKWLSEKTGMEPLKIQHLFRGLYANQLDYAFKEVGIVTGHYKPEEVADWPVVGKMFIRESKGWGAASPQKIKKLQGEYKLYMKRFDKKILELPEKEFKQWVGSRGMEEE
jgi:hypothetical protein